MSRFWTELVTTLTPYVPGEQPRHERLVKLNTNEFPYPPAPSVHAAIAAVPADVLRRYPDPEASALRQAFARRSGLAPEQVFVGNGSDEVLAFAFLGLLKQAEPLYFPDITYSFYRVWSDLCDIDYREVPVAADYAVQVDAFPAVNGGVIIANPNAPTGMLLDLASIRALLRRSSNSVVVVDEAYIDFGGESALALVDEFDNLLVVQTLSKSRALAGLRIGVAAGHRDLIEALDRVKNSFNSYPLDVLAQLAGVAALADDVYFAQTCHRVIASRERLAEELCALGFQVLPSAANFLFASHDREPAKAIYAGLRQRGVLVRHFDRPRLDNFLRITVGTEEECAALLSALRDVLAAA